MISHHITQAVERHQDPLGSCLRSADLLCHQRLLNHTRLSSADVDGLDDAEIWKLGDEAVGRPRGRSIKAKAHLNVVDFRSLDLTPNPDDDPLRHVDIIGWPLNEAEQLSVAQQLAAKVLERSSFRIK